MKSASNRTKYFLAVISLGFVYGSMFNLAYMKYIFYDAMLEAMQCTNTQLGLLITVYTIVSCVGLLPGGWIADRCKTKGIIVVSAYLQAAVSIFFAFTMRSYACAMITWIISGTAMAVASIVGFNLPDICLPAIIGNWLDKYGNAAYSKVFTLLCGMCIAGMLAALSMVLLNKKEAKAANT